MYQGQVTEVKLMSVLLGQHDIVDLHLLPYSPESLTLQGGNTTHTDTAGCRDNNHISPIFFQQILAPLSLLKHTKNLFARILFPSSGSNILGGRGKNKKKFGCCFSLFTSQSLSQRASEVEDDHRLPDPNLLMDFSCLIIIPRQGQ